MSANPVRGADRIETLDLIRGIAILGILVMNIMSFANIYAFYNNPYALGEPAIIDKATWMLTRIFANQKFMTLFSILYGAGIWLFCKRVEDRGEKAGGLFVRRSIWLAVFGLLHGWMLWYGDILFHYATIGLLVFFFRKMKPGKLAILGSLMLLVPPLLFTAIGLLSPDGGVAENWNPSTEMIATKTAAYLGDYQTIFLTRAPVTLAMELGGLILYIFWRSGGLMLWGIALMQWGFMQGNLPTSVYKKTIIIGGILGFIFTGLTVFGYETTNYLGGQTKFLITIPDFFGTLGTSAAYLSIIILLARKKVLLDWFAPVGRMAFTNYLGQTVIWTTVFYGYGFGLFGKLGYFQLQLCVVASSIFQILTSKWWLNHFRFGPAEWLWRSLTYRKFQSMKRPKS